MRIATWNVNGLRARLDFVLHWLRARKPDLVALQELKLADEQFPHMAFEAEGYVAAVHAQKAWNGVAVLSRKPLQQLQSGLPGQEHSGARLITVDSGGLQFTSVYCPNGKSVGHDDFPRKLAWFDSLAAYLREHHDPTQPLVVGGDFNLCPTRLDSWNEDMLNGSIFHTEEERRKFADLTDWGLHDVFREQHPDEAAFSWWDYRGGAFHRRQGLRIDFLLATEPVARRVQETTIDREYRKKQDGMVASDHAPVIADLD